MSKREKEIAIIEGIKALPDSGYGKYHYAEELKEVIDKVMGYGKYRGYGSIYFPKEVRTEECIKIRKIIHRMFEKKVILYSESGAMFKLAKTV